MSRRTSRDTTMKLLYQLEIQKENREEQIAATLEEKPLEYKDEIYIIDVVKGVFDNLEYIDTIIINQLKGWKINRISKVDLSILRLSIFEIYFREDIPFNVSVNEAVELAKKYSNVDSGSFINGILSKLHKPE